MLLGMGLVLLMAVVLAVIAVLGGAAEPTRPASPFAAGPEQSPPVE